MLYKSPALIVIEPFEDALQSDLDYGTKRSHWIGRSAIREREAFGIIQGLLRFRLTMPNERKNRGGVYVAEVDWEVKE